jgi:hypothetical protein
MRGTILWAAVACATGLAAVVGCKTNRPESAVLSDGGADFLAFDSPAFMVPEAALGLHADYTGAVLASPADKKGTPVSELGIGRKALAMVLAAKTRIVASAFLFDCMYGPGAKALTEAEAQELVDAFPRGWTKEQADKAARHITEVLGQAIITRKRAEKGLQVSIVLDPLNRAYVDRGLDGDASGVQPETFQRMHRENIDFFYSDLSQSTVVSDVFPKASIVPGTTTLRTDDRADAFTLPVDQATADRIQAELAKRPAISLTMNKLRDAHRAGLHVDAYDPIAQQALLTMLDRWASLASLVDTDGKTSTKIDPGQVKTLLETAWRAKQAPKLPDGTVIGIDGVPMTLEMAYNLAQLKANHRKLLVTDKDGALEALVASANPHDASYGSANYGISVVGSPAAFVYNVIRADIAHSLERARQAAAQNPAEPDRYARRFAYLGKDSAAKVAADVRAYVADGGILPSLKLAADPAGATAQVKVVTEQAIKAEVLKMLAAVGPNDVVRIQMFYLSQLDVVAALLQAARKLSDASTQLKIVLDPNKDAFNNIKDGTPNRQVARYLVEQLQAMGVKDPRHTVLKWYSTHGEQNHAKIMSVTNDAAKKYEIITGSANWSSKNIGSPNMESDLAVRGAKGVVDAYNKIFDGLWSNAGGVEYTIAYDDARFGYDKDTAADPTTKDGTKATATWIVGELVGLVAW